MKGKWNGSVEWVRTGDLQDVVSCYIQRRAGRGLKVVDAQFGEKENRDRMKVLKMGPGDSRPLGSEPCSLEPHHIYLVSWQQNLLCCMKSASCVPGHVSHFIDYFKLSLLLSCTRAVI